MVDSINFIIKNVKYIDFNHLIRLEIHPKSYTIKRRNFKCDCCSFKYKDIEFKYNKNFKYILMITNVHKLLKKRDIHINDLQEYKQKVYKIASEVFGTTNIQLELSRIDYCIDISLDTRTKSRYIFLLNNMHKLYYKYMKTKKVYGTSIHKSNVSGQTNLNIYLRWYYTEKEEDKDILRLEVQVKKEKIKIEYLKYGIEKNLESYWSKDSFYENTIEFLKDYLYEGNYCSRKRAKEIIKKSNYKDSEKNKLLKFLLMVDRYGIEDIVKVRKIYCKSTVDKYIQMLNDININPITIPRIWDDTDEIENLLKVAKRTAEEKYFCEEDV